METSVFINRLKELVFDKSKLQHEGFSDEYSNSLINAFYLSSTNTRSLKSNIILKLIEEYQCEVLGIISSISFNEEINETEKYYLIGWVQGEDLLAINKSNGEVVMLAFWDYDVITFYCAVNSNQFLEAFLIHGVSPLDKHFENDEEQWLYNTNKAKEAASIAGGNKYLKFWMSLYQ